MKKVNLPVIKIKPRLSFTLLAAGVLLLTANSAIASAPPKSGGGGGNGGGGATSCTPIQSFNVVPGYRLGGAAWAAVWTSYSLKQCTSSAVYQAKVIVTNLDLNQVELIWPLMLMGDTIDDDNAKFNCNYRVTWS